MIACAYPNASVQKLCREAVQQRILGFKPVCFSHPLQTWTSGAVPSGTRGVFSAGVIAEMRPVANLRVVRSMLINRPSFAGQSRRAAESYAQLTGGCLPPTRCGPGSAGTCSSSAATLKHRRRQLHTSPRLGLGQTRLRPVIHTGLGEKSGAGWMVGCLMVGLAKS